MNEAVPDALRGLLHVGRQAYVALEDSENVHVTPVLYAWADGRLWFAAAAGTRKVQLLRRATQAGVLVEAGGRRVLLAGEAEVIDPARPLSLLGTPREVTTRAWSLGLYGARNLVDLAGFARDAVAFRNGPVRPRRRVFVALRPWASALFDGERLTGLWGRWPDVPPPAQPAAPAPTGVAAVLGWCTEEGPVALPSRWDTSRSAASLDPSAAAMLGLGRRSPACVVVDDYGGAGPRPKRGTAIHGVGELVDDGGRLWVHLEPERVASWSGATSGSRRVAPSQRSA